MTETGRAAVLLPDGATEFDQTIEAAGYALEALDRLGRERPARRVSEPRYIGIRQIQVGGRDCTVAEYEADFEVPVPA